MASVLDSVSPRRGRPRKFGTPSRAVTLTLPEHVIDALGAIDADLSRAVVRLAQPELAKLPHKAAELSSFGRHAVIVVTPTRALEQRTGVVLVPLPDGRALISFEQPTTVADLELLIEDAVEGGRLSEADQAIFEGIADILRTARRSGSVVLRQHHIIVLEWRGRKPAAPSRTPARTRARAHRLTHPLT